MATEVQDSGSQLQAKIQALMDANPGMTQEEAATVLASGDQYLSTGTTSSAKSTASGSILDTSSATYTKSLALIKKRIAAGVKIKDPTFVKAASLPERAATARQLANKTITKNTSTAERKAIQQARMWYTGQIKGGSAATKTKTGQTAYYKNKSVKALLLGKTNPPPKKKTTPKSGTGDSGTNAYDEVRNRYKNKAGTQGRGGTNSLSTIQKKANTTPVKAKTPKPDKTVKVPKTTKDSWAQQKSTSKVPSLRRGSTGTGQPTPTPPATPQKKDPFKGRKSKDRSGSKVLSGAGGAPEFGKAAVAKDKQVTAREKVLKDQAAKRLTAAPGFKHSPKQARQTTGLAIDAAIAKYGGDLGKALTGDHAADARVTKTVWNGPSGKVPKSPSQSQSVAARAARTAKQVAAELAGVGVFPDRPKLTPKPKFSKRKTGKIGGGR